jgi:light-regulated signal transduction histidine kinase (bacteriophytochrome)
MSAVRFGEADLSTCDREPIHIPGSIQPHGVLLVLDRQRQTVEQVAGDTASLFGVAPDQLLGLPAAELMEFDTGKFMRAQLAAPASFIAPLMRLGVRSRTASVPLDLTLHAVGTTAILELEPARRPMNGAGDPAAQLKSLLAAVQHTSNLEECCNAAAVAMRTATGFDRAMVYRFLPDGSGVVAAEDANLDLE